MRDLQFHGAAVHGSFGPEGYGCCGCPATPSDTSGYGIVLPFTKEWTMVHAARKQVADAMILKDLAGYRAADNINIFMQVPGSRSDAHFHAAYWMAVAARILKDKSLAALAYKKMAWATAQAQTPGSTMLLRGTAEDIRNIMGYAANKIGEEAAKDGQSGNPNIKAILAMMGHHTAQGVAESGIEHRQAMSLPGQALQTLESPPDDDGGWPTWAKVLLVVGGATAIGGAIYYAQKKKKGGSASPLAF